MREIKFRGKSTMDIEEMDKIGLKHINGWVHGNLVMYGNQPFIVGDFIEVEEEYTINEWWCPVHADSLGQFTGLKDKNGTEIYEGDIVLYNSIFSNKESNLIVEWSEIDAAFFIGSVRTDIASKFSKVIGNICEHKHLLEAK